MELLWRNPVQLANVFTGEGFCIVVPPYAICDGIGIPLEERSGPASHVTSEEAEHEEIMEHC
jgi:hypothetical protein